MSLQCHQLTPGAESASVTVPELTLPTLSAVLLQAMTDSNEVRSAAERVLSQWEHQPGYCSTLLMVFADTSIDASVRMSAVLCFKNGINRYWRKRPSGGIQDNEKTHLRTRLVQLMEEPVDRVAVLLAHLIAKIARFDYPQAWPTLFSDLVEQVQKGSVLQQRRSLMVIHHSVKELSTKVLQANRRQFQEVAPQMLQFVFQVWEKHSGALATDPLSAEFSLLSLKVLRRLVTFGYARVDKADEVRTLFTSLLTVSNHCQSLRASAIAASSNVLEVLERVIALVAKTFTEVQTVHPLSFHPFLAVVLQTCLGHVTRAQEVSSVAELMEVLVVRSMLFLRNVLSCHSYRVPTGKTQIQAPLGNSDLPTGEQIQQIISTVLTPDALKQLQHLLITRYFPLTPDELEEWSSDPESFLHEDALDFNDRLRPCAEGLYTTMLQSHRDLLAPEVLALLHHAAAADCSADLNALLLKDAVYLAVGIGAYELYDFVHFTSWFNTHLYHEITATHPRSNIMKRRVAWLLGAWVDKIKDCRPAVYSSLLQLLRDSDLVVRMSSRASLNTLIGDCNFYVDVFEQYLSPVCDQLFDLLAQANDTDLKLQVLNLISLLMERMGEKTRPIVSQVLQWLPVLWQGSEENLLRSAVVIALTRLVNTLGSESQTIHNFVIPVVQFSIDLSQPASLYLLDDGLDLWAATLVHATTFTPELLALYPCLTAVMEADSEHLVVCFRILTSYLLLGRQQFMQAHGVALVKMVQALLGNVKDRGTLIVAAALELTVELFGTDVVPMLNDCLRLVLASVLGKQEADLVVAAYLNVFARLLLSCPVFFFEFFQSTGGHTTLLPFLDIWLDKVDSMVSTSKRKLTALALCNIIPSTDKRLLAHLPSIINVCVDVYHELHVESAADLFPRYSEKSADGTEEAESVRKSQLRECDAVTTSDLALCLNMKLRECAANNGNDVFMQALATVDEDILRQLPRHLQWPTPPTSATL